MVDLKNEPQSAIDAHGIIGDMRSAALVNDKGSIDFFCWPEFDSPSIFCSLLDSPDAGIFQLTPDLPNARREQIYLPDTNVLQTRWLSERAVVEVTDLLPIGDSEDDLPVLMRRVRVVSGRATFHMRCAVRHDYARADTRAQMDQQDVTFSASGQPTLRLASDQPMQIDKQAAVAQFTLKQDETAAFMLGAEGAWVGTAFLATHEAGIEDFQKEAIVDGGDLIVLKFQHPLYGLTNRGVVLGN